MTPKLLNIVALGGFNPAILSINFLQNVCKIPLENPKEQITPVDSQVIYGNITFNASLDRFEVAETDPRNLTQSKINQYAKCYIDTLPHTPIRAWGTNIHIEVPNLKKEILQEYFVDNHSSLFKALKSTGLIVRNDVKVTENNEEIIQYTVKFVPKVPDILGTILIKPLKDAVYAVNYNYEIRKKEDFHLILDSLQNRITEFTDFVKLIG